VENRRPIVALVDNDPLVRVPVARGLDDAGYHVIGAANVVEALALLEDRSLAAAVVNVELSGRMSGLAAVSEARRNNPNLKVIFVGGASQHDCGGASFLEKPYHISDLVTLLGRLVQAGQRRSAHSGHSEADACARPLE
jgi:DNA-binding NtrC family response regulator